MAGLKPLAFEVEAQAIARAVVRQSDQRTHMIVDQEDAFWDWNCVTRDAALHLNDRHRRSRLASNEQSAR